MGSGLRTRFNKEEADRAVGFFARHLPIVEGPKAGQPFTLESFQEDPVREVFGKQVYESQLKQWVRQIRTVYEEVPRKNGKSPKGAGIGLKCTFADGEPGAENFCVAEDVDQANRIFGMAGKMVEASPTLSRRAKLYKRLIEDRKTGNILRVIPGDAAGNLQHNPHFVGFDELRTQKTRELWDAMTTGGGTRAQPLTWAFSTAGTDRTSICREVHDYGEKVKQGIVIDPTFLYIRYGIEEGEDWEDEKVWQRHNPALGKFLLMSFLRSEYVKAKASPARQNTFRNLYLNEWTQQSVRWIDMGLWDRQAGLIVEENLKNELASGGLDLASVSDLTAWVLVFPKGADECKEHPKGGCIQVLARFFCPEAQLEKGPKKDLYREWKKDGWLQVTPGNSTDYAFVRKQVNEDVSTFDLRGLSMDYKFQGGQLGGELVDDLGEDFVTRFGRGYAGFAAPMQELERLLLEGMVHHGGNPVLRWMADNVVVKQGAMGDLIPDRDKSQDKIDGIVALVMAIDGLIGAEESGPLVTVV